MNPSRLPQVPQLRASQGYPPWNPAPPSNSRQDMAKPRRLDAAKLSRRMAFLPFRDLGELNRPFKAPSVAKCGPNPFWQSA